MLETLDVLIGFTVVMLVMSLAITMLTQALVSAINLKGRQLRGGLAQLLALLDRGITPKAALGIADQILRHPLIARRSLGRRSLSSAIHREELITLMLEFASGADASKVEVLAAGAGPPGAGEPEKLDIAGLQAKVASSLKNNGIDDPEGLLRQIRAASLELERTFPELSTSARQSAAILRLAASEFTGKVNAWFDQTIDRVIDSFTAHARVVTVVASAIVVISIQLDSLDLLNRLSSDDDLRRDVAGWAINHPDELERIGRDQGAARALEAAVGLPAGSIEVPPPASPLQTTPAAAGAANSVDAVGPLENGQVSSAGSAAGATNGGAETRGSVEAGASVPDRAGTTAGEQAATTVEPAATATEASPVPQPGEALNEELAPNLSLLVDRRIIRLPWGEAAEGAGWREGPWWKNWKNVNPLGILISILLLSIGAPFWYETLKKLVGLRSVISAKDDVQRAERQTDQASGGRIPAGATPSPAASAFAKAAGANRSDVNALG